MKKKLLLIATAIALVVAMAVPALALAKSQASSGSTPAPARDSLAVVAPLSAEAGATVQMTVFKASDQTPMAGAEVWAVAGANITILKDALAKLKGEPADQLQAAAQQALNTRANLLGRTDASGSLLHAFNQSGRYLLVALEPGFLPGFRPIGIGRAALPTLVIEAPNRAAVSQKLDLTVLQQGTQEGLGDVNVWILSRAQAQALKTSISDLRQSGNTTAILTTIEKTATAGVLLGTTNGAGKIDPQPSIQIAGGYLLIGLKHGYRPGLKAIMIEASLQSLTIQSPSRATIGEKVSIDVNNKAAQTGVKDIQVWALNRPQAQALRDNLAGISGNRTAIEAAIRDALSTAKLLGSTNGDGKLEPQPIFQTAGGYLLIAVGQGYRPALKGIFVTAPASQPRNSQSPNSGV